MVGSLPGVSVCWGWSGWIPWPSAPQVTAQFPSLSNAIQWAVAQSTH